MSTKKSKSSSKKRGKSGKKSLFKKLKETKKACGSAILDARIYYDNHKSAVCWSFLIMFCIGVIASSTIFVHIILNNAESKIITKEQAAIEAANKMVEEQRLAAVQDELKRDQNIKAAKEQVVLAQGNGVKFIYNKNEDTMSDLYRGRFVNWAKKKGYDGIVFGQIQPMFDGAYKYATYSGHNMVSLDHVVEKLRLAGCENVISVMINRHNFPLPYPFKNQINGDLKIYERNIKFASIVPTWNSEIVIEADNFHATMDHDGNIVGGPIYQKPWQMKLNK